MQKLPAARLTGEVCLDYVGITERILNAALTTSIRKGCAVKERRSMNMDLNSTVHIMLPVESSGRKQTLI